MPKRKKSVAAGESYTPRHLPKSMLDAFGILKDQPLDPVRLQRKLRNEWERRLKRQVSLASRQPAP